VDESIIMVIVTTSSKQEAQNIVSELLKKRLVACGNIIGPISSSFWWKGTIENSEEFLILMKSQMVLFKKLEHEILELHSYEIPEIVVLPIIEGSKAYLNWVTKSLSCT
jgi:periplasmic divalent cation tolerance protein